MVRLDTVEAWQEQVTYLLQARPSTARITTKYTLPNLDLPKYQTGKKRKRNVVEGEKKDEPADTTRTPRATLTLKAYDPESGVTLKFKTDKSADVGRTIAGLGRVGRYMAALPEKTEAQDIAMQDAIADNDASGEKDTTAPQSTATMESKPVPPAAGASVGSGGGRKKKKKGKK